MNPDLRSATDAELERRAATGDRQAFGELYDRHAGRVYDFLLRMVRDPDEAADLMQETFVRAMKALSPERAGGAAFSTWVFTIARNLALTRLERQKRTTALAETPEDDDEAPTAYYQLEPSRLGDPEEAARASELAALVWEAAQGLDPRQYSLLDLHVRQGLDSAEIAQVLGVTKGNAYTMVSRLKDAFESAVASLMLLRLGRQRCQELDDLLRQQAVASLSPSARRLIERHSAACPTCQGERQQLVSASAILRALALLAIPLALKKRVADAAWEAACAEGAAAGSGAAAGAATAGAPSGLTGHLGYWAGQLAGASLPVQAGVVATVLTVASLAGGTVFFGARALTGPDGGPAPETTSVVRQVAALSDRPTASTSRSAPSPIRADASVATAAAHATLAAALATLAATAQADTTPPPDTPTPPPPPPTQAASLPPPTEAPPPPEPTATPPPPCGAPQPTYYGAAAPDDAYASSLLALVDQYRTQRGLPPLAPDQRLATAAAEYAKFVVESRWWTQMTGTNIHLGPDCRDMYDRAIASGYPPAWIGENVMWGSLDLPVEQMFSILLSSPHEDPARDLFVYTGISCWVRQAGTPERACVQVFGSVP